MEGKSSPRTVVALGVLVAGLVSTPLAQASEYDEALAAIGTELVTCIKAGERGRVAAVDFTDLQMNVSELGRLIAEELSTELVRQAGGEFAIIDRNHLQTILREYELSAAGLVNPENAKKVGQFAGVDTLITGNVFELENTIRVTAKAMDTASATIVCATRGDLPKTMMLREIAGVAAGSSAAPTTAASSTETSAPPPEYRDKFFHVSVQSATKTRDGRRVELVLAVNNASDNDMKIALNSRDLPRLSDNIGTAWGNSRCSGIDTKDAEARYQRTGEPTTGFPASHRLLLSCSFTSSSGSAGTSFTFTSSVIAEYSKRMSAGGFGGTVTRQERALLSFGLSGITIR